MPLTDCKPGVYPNLPIEQYWQIDAVNHSTLSKFDPTPAHAFEAMRHPEKPAKVQDLGHLAHVAILEPKLFERLYVCFDEWLKTPSGSIALEAFTAVRKNRLEKGEIKKGLDAYDRNTLEGKAMHRAFEADTAGRLPISLNDTYTIRGMSSALRNNSITSAFLTGGQREVTIVWRDEETGLLCKSRLDLINVFMGQSFICDLKTAMDAESRSFARACAKFNYDSQAAMYRAGVNALAKHIKALDRSWRFVHLVVEASRPYGVAVYELNDAAMGTGELKWRAWLKTYAECTSSGKWPCYPEGITPLALPRYAVDSSLRHMEE